MIKYKLNGKYVSGEEFRSRVKPKKDWLESPPMVSDTYSEHDPLVSQGCGVMKSQVNEAREMIRKHNIKGARVRDDGAMEFTSRNGRKEFLYHRDLRDLDAGYGDG
jgi:hypothetical protein